MAMIGALKGTAWIMPRVHVHLTQQQCNSDDDGIHTAWDM